MMNQRSEITINGQIINHVTSISFDEEYNLLLQFHHDSRMRDNNDLSKLMKYDLRQVYKETENIGVFEVKINKPFAIDIEE